MHEQRSDAEVLDLLRHCTEAPLLLSTGVLHHDVPAGRQACQPSTSVKGAACRWAQLWLCAASQPT